MDRANITTITDVETLHQLLVEQWCTLDERDQIIIEREQVIARHAQVIAKCEHVISQHEVQIAQHEALIARHEQTITHKQARIAVLTAEIARLRRVQFAARSEKMDPAQRALFDENMAADIAAVEAQLEALQEPEPSTETATRNKPTRRPLPEHLERIETRHEPEACTCGECGSALVHIGDHVSGPLLRILRSRHLHIHVQRSCRASHCSSSCAATCIRSTPAGAARR